MVREPEDVDGGPEEQEPLPSHERDPWDGPECEDPEHVEELSDLFLFRDLARTAARGQGLQQELFHENCALNMREPHSGLKCGPKRLPLGAS